MQKGVKSHSEMLCAIDQKKSKSHNSPLENMGQKWPSRLQRPQELVLPHQSRLQVPTEGPAIN
jgi:hypothetical protein